jgi:hypothetical protein
LYVHRAREEGERGRERERERERRGGGAQVTSQMIKSSEL